MLLQLNVFWLHWDMCRVGIVRETLFDGSRKNTKKHWINNLVRFICAFNVIRFIPDAWMLSDGNEFMKWKKKPMSGWFVALYFPFWNYFKIDNQQNVNFYKRYIFALLYQFPFDGMPKNMVCIDLTNVTESISINIFFGCSGNVLAEAMENEREKDRERDIWRGSERRAERERLTWCKYGYLAQVIQRYKTPEGEHFVHDFYYKRKWVHFFSTAIT